MKGLAINEKVLKALGAEPAGKYEWHLLSRGYLLIWKWKTDKHVNHGKPTWSFYLGEDNLRRGIGHSVTHLDECFGMLAEDMFEEGKKERSKEVRELLDIKQRDDQ